jgi:hypothetical protein
MTHNDLVAEVVMAWLRTVSARVTQHCEFTQIDWVYRLYASSGILKKIGKTTFRKLHLFPFSGEGKETLCWVP